MKKIALLILDGWGYSHEQDGNAIHLAQTPHMDHLIAAHPFALLESSGEAVGLPEGQMGNSEVGHLNLGAGRVVYQELTRINYCIKNGEFYQNEVFLEAMNRAKKSNSALHLIGLVSDGGVHSHLNHLLALLKMAAHNGNHAVYIHAILDGRDTMPYAAAAYLETLQQAIKDNQVGVIATISGRYYAMDRDQRWDRFERAYRAYIAGHGLQEADPFVALQKAYDRGEGDEFVQPTVITDQQGRPRTMIKSDDSVIFFNFRPDRARQISRAFTDAYFSGFDRGPQPPFPYYVTMTNYDQTMDVPVAFTLDDLQDTLGEVYAARGLTQIRIAETEKYAHVTFFFNGGREKVFAGEDRILIPSPKVATYDLQPEMSADQVTAAIVKTIKNNGHDLIIANYANVDMVGHSGKIEAAIKAVETVDRGVGTVLAAAEAGRWSVLVCADHGNAEEMENSEMETVTAHSSNPVPLLLIDPDQLKLREKGILADVAPTILDLAGIPAPAKMTGTSMLVR